ncbi:MAG: winged helix-turn-helix transcriptional regulator [Chloroflexi bacterium]|nr:winged helix-turn-helix transcriptional regulator [Chloroflexota bacterium]
MVAGTDMPNESVQLHAYLCSGLADAKRIAILYLLSEGPKNVNTLARTLGISQPTVSRHLKILRERGLVRAQRRKQAVYYTLNDRRVIQALDLLREVMRDHLLSQAHLLSPDTTGATAG